jgi:hypothetical protein
MPSGKVPLLTEGRLSGEMVEMGFQQVDCRGRGRCKTHLWSSSRAVRRWKVRLMSKNEPRTYELLLLLQDALPTE